MNARSNLLTALETGSVADSTPEALVGAYRAEVARELGDRILSSARALHGEWLRATEIRNALYIVAQAAERGGSR
ncbi:hypothetical protein ACF1DY_25905 [Streptomyces albus]